MPKAHGYRIPPYVTAGAPDPRYPERVPADGVLPEPDEHCMVCPARVLVIFQKVCTKTTGDPHVYPPAGAGVLDIHFCGHHGTARQGELVAAGWLVVRDYRQHLAAQEARR